MAEQEPYLRTRIGGEFVDLPGSIGSIRASLPEDRRAAFDAAIDEAPLMEVPLIAARWGLPQEAIDEDEALIEQLKRGDFSGFAEMDESAGSPQ
ncbi:hypothetical protein [Embleya hyalina]|uniref:Uncharacterized protein n=1 Tax=Embleya hyalina TaxID=516124 RepID=A0A401YYH8_9ACTN|nr:hypothetical protein [Embleya hyalina]GCD99682.1 hypothetical protein EHYA_07404 [Embleya hyalina]